MSSKRRAKTTNTRSQPGRPAFAPTGEQCANVETMAGRGIPHEDICRLVINPQTNTAIDAKTLRLHFRAELDTGHVKANVNVVGALYDNALKGNVTAQIWWTKARMGWSERLPAAGMEVVVKPDGNAACERIRARLDEMAARAAGEDASDQPAGGGGATPENSRA